MSSGGQWNSFNAYPEQSDGLLQMMEEEEMASNEEQEPNVQTPQDAVDNLGEIDVEQAANWVGSNCSFFCHSISSPPKTRSIPRNEMQSIASAAHADPDAIQTSLKIFDPKEFPIIKEGAAVQKRFDALINKYAVPKQTLVRGLAAKTAEENGGLKQVVDNERDKGRYMILNENIDTFVTQFDEIMVSYMDWGQRLLQRYETIKERDKTRLADFWPLIRHKYPSQVYVESKIRVRSPSFESANHMLSTTHLPQRMREALTEQYKSEAASQVQACCKAMTQALLDAVTLATKQLGRRTRVNPAVEDPDYAHLRDGEVALFESHEDAKEDIPEDFIRVKIQIVKTDENGKRTNKRDQQGNPATEVLLISEEEFTSRLKPRQTNDEYCRLFDGQIQALIDMGDKLHKFEGLLDVGNSPLKSFSDQVQTILTAHGESSSSITNSLKNSGLRRDTVHGQLSDLKGKLAEQLVIQGKKKKVSRRNLGV